MGRSPWTARDAPSRCRKRRQGPPRGRGRPPHELLRTSSDLSQADSHLAYYNESLPLLELIHPRSRSSLWALIAIYSRLLERIEATDYDVFSRRVRLSLFEKSWIVVRALAS